MWHARQRTSGTGDSATAPARDSISVSRTSYLFAMLTPGLAAFAALSCDGCRPGSEVVVCRLLTACTYHLASLRLQRFGWGALCTESAGSWQGAQVQLGHHRQLHQAHWRVEASALEVRHNHMSPGSKAAGCVKLGIAQAA